MRELFLSIVDALWPPRRTELLVRSLTLRELRRLDEEILPYHDPRVTALVWELKYYGSGRSAELAGRYLGEQLLALAAEELGRPLLVPIPMHPVRRRERGHNQTESLCRALLPYTGGALEYAPQALRRIAHTPTQQGLPKAERMRNVQDCMQAESAMVTGRVCIVVDDVTTTGATLAEAKRALREAGARVVHCVALARS